MFFQSVFLPKMWALLPNLNISKLIQCLPWSYGQFHVNLLQCNFFPVEPFSRALCSRHLLLYLIQYQTIRWFLQDVFGLPGSQKLLDLFFWCDQVKFLGMGKIENYLCNTYITIPYELPQKSRSYKGRWQVSWRKSNFEFELWTLRVFSCTRNVWYCIYLRLWEYI